MMSQRIALEQALLDVLVDGPIRGARSLAHAANALRGGLEAIPIEHLHAYADTTRALIDRGWIVAVADGYSLDFGLSRRGQRARMVNRCRHQIPSFTPLRLSLGISYVLLAGCSTQATTPPSRPMLFAYPEMTGLGQIRDARSGESVFVPCNPCGVPTAKTPLADAEVSLTRAVPAAFVGDAPIAASMHPVATPPTKAPATTRSLRETVYFSSGKADIRNDAFMTVTRLAQKSTSAVSIRIRGATDASGDPSQNRVLAAARAKAVADALVKAGVDRTKIALSFCTDCYVAANNDSIQRQFNRRADVELVLPIVASTGG